MTKKSEVAVLREVAGSVAPPGCAARRCTQASPLSAQPRSQATMGAW